MTLKEYLKQSNPRLDKLAEEAEIQRTADEEYAYEKGGDYMYYLLITGRIVTERDLRMAYEICNGCTPGIHPGHYEEWIHSIYGIRKSIPKNEMSIAQLVKSGNKVEAVKLYREINKCSLFEAKEAVDKM